MTDIPAPPVRSAPQLRRSASDRVLLGVCGGLGDSVGVDPVLLRLAFVLAEAAGGIGIFAYLAAAVVLPGPPAGEPRRPRPVRRQEVVAIVLLLVTACIALSGADLLLPLGILIPGGLLLGGLALIWRRASSRASPATARRRPAGRGRWRSTCCASAAASRCSAAARSCCSTSPATSPAPALR